MLIDDKWNARISDFGIAKFKEESKNARKGQSIGTVYWTAPELLEDIPATEKCDCITSSFYSF
jgi:serine/threonine protein kinase